MKSFDGIYDVWYNRSFERNEICQKTMESIERNRVFTDYKI